MKTMVALLLFTLLEYDIRDKIISEWHSYESKIRNGSSGTVQMTVRRPYAEPVSFSYLLKWKENAMIYCRNRANSEEQVLDGRNMFYCFQIKRPSPKDAWVLAHISSREKNPDCFANSARQVAMLMQLPLYPGITNDASLVEAVMLPNTKVNRENADTLTIAFSRENKRKRSGYLVEGAITVTATPPFLPRRATFIVEYHDKDIVREFTTLEYAYSGPGLQHLSSMKRSGRLIDKDVSTGEVEYNVVSFHISSEMPESAFSLSAYGLEEYHGVTWPKPTPYWLYGTILAVVVIFTGIVLVRWSLKPKAA